MTGAIEIRLLAPGEDAVLDRVADSVFDRGVDRALVRAFLNDPRHHLVVAIDAGVVVGFASGVDYIHPDKPAQMFINEVGTADTHRQRGIARAVLAALLEHARAIGCSEAWVLTDHENRAARRLYGGQGGTATEAALMFSFPLST